MTDSQTLPQRTHTPGPWRSDRDARAVYAGDMRICDIRGWGHLTGQGHTALDLSPQEAVVIQTANARLIAAAPDMLAALKAVRKVIAEASMTGFNCNDGDWAERLFASQQITHAAVAKAEGKIP